MGGRSARQLREFTERYPFVCHGLSLSLGGSGPLDEALLYRIRDFMREHGMTLYTEHLSWCADDRQLYDLLPIPQTEAAVRWTAERIRRVQDILGQQHRHRERLDLRRPARRRDERSRIHQRRGRSRRLPASPRRQQHLRQ
jgi:uncharacterized protein (UPF0276 family)